MWSPSTLSYVFSFCPDGVPLAAAAANPIVRLAAETYRAEENYVWTANGLEEREIGDREHFHVFEARRERKAGVRVGPLIVVFHDSTGHRTHLEHVRDPLDSPRASTPLDLYASMDTVRREYYGKDNFRSVWCASERARSRRQVIAPTGGNAKWRKTNHILVEIAVDPQHATGLHFFPGPNRRSIYLWMDGVRRPPCDSVSDEEARAASLQELLDCTQWWLRRPPVTSMRYWHSVYSGTTHLLPPVPPQLYLHLYGERSGGIAQVCRTFLQGRNASKIHDVACGNEVKRVSTHNRGKDESLDMLFGSPVPRRGKVSPRSTALSMPAEGIIGSVRGIPPPIMTGLFVISHPQLKMSLSHDEGGRLPGLPPAVIGNLRILKLSGISAEDEGLQGLLHHGRVDTSTIGGNTIAGPGTNIPFLEVCDVGFNERLTIFPLLYRADLLRSATASGPAASSLRNLTLLNVQCTAVNDEVVSVMALHCISLQQLYMGSCQYITNLTPLAALNRLRILDVHATAITDVGITALGFNRSLEEIVMSGCTGIHDITPLAYIETLRRLDLRNVLVRTGLDRLRACPRLHDLLLAEYSNGPDSVPGFGPPPAPPTYLVHLQSLSHLSITEMPFVTGSALEALVRSRAPISVLHLIQVAGLESLNALAGMSSLQTLYINEAQLLTADSIAGLGMCQNMQQCTIRGCRRLCDFNCLSEAPRLRYLDVAQNGVDVESSSLSRFRKAKGPVETILLSQYECIHNLAFVKGLPHLRELDVSHTGVDTVGLRTLVAAVRLETLHCNFCAMVTSVSALEGLPHLRHLDLTGTGITDHGLCALPSLPSLEVLLLTGCHALRFLTPQDVFPALKGLSVGGNSQLNDAAMHQFFRLSSPKMVDGQLTQTPFPFLEEVDFCGCPITSVDPLVYQKALRKLCLRATPMTHNGMLSLVSIPTLCSLDIQEVSTLTALDVFCTRTGLRQLDTRGVSPTTAVSGGTGEPVDVSHGDALRTSGLRELKVTGSVKVIRSIWELLRDDKKTDLPQLHRLILSGPRSEELDGCTQQLLTRRPLLTIRHV